MIVSCPSLLIGVMSDITSIKVIFKFHKGRFKYLHVHKKIMKSVETLLYLQRNGITVFTTRDLAKIIGKPIGYARSVISRIPGVKKAERGLYYTEQASIYEIASNVVPFSYVSMLSALRFYDVITQIPATIEVISPKRHRPMSIGGYRVRFVRLKRNLIFGNVRRGNAFIAEPEKAVLDSLYQNSYAHIDEAIKRGVEEGLMSVDKLIRYAQVFHKRSLLNKLGFFMEHYAGIRRPELRKGMSVKSIWLVPHGKNYDRGWKVYYG